MDWLADLRENLKEQQPGDVEWRSGLLNRLINAHIHKLKEFAKQNDRAGFDALVEQEIRDREEG